MTSGTSEQSGTLPPYITREEISRRLFMIFPEGTRNRMYCIRPIAASTVFTMIYIGAIEGKSVFLGPKHVYRMTDAQSEMCSPEARIRYRTEAFSPGFSPIGTRWYADNTRESIRDETLREGLMQAGAVVARTDLPTTSSKPRYALKHDFASLFHPPLAGIELEIAIKEFQRAFLTSGALARISIIRRGAARGTAGHLVTFPSGETRKLAPGKSSTIAKAVIEVFASQFLQSPAVLWLSESGNKVVARDEGLAAAIGLVIESDRNLPDIVLVELAANQPLLLFVEVVATDGPVNERRREAILRQTDAAGFSRSRVAFMTAYEDRESPEFRRTIGSVAWDTYVWFASEPDCIIVCRREGAQTLFASGA